MPVDAAHLLRDGERLTPTYTKPLRRAADGTWHELNRLDLRNRATLSPHTQELLCQKLSAVFAATDGLIVLDQVNEEGWGVVTPGVRDHLARLAAGREADVHRQPDADCEVPIGHAEAERA